MEEKNIKTEEEWKKNLTPEQYYVFETERNRKSIYRRVR
jgi:hypothetical protein